MSELSRLFDLRRYEASSLSEMLADFSKSGVIRDADNEFAVTAGGGMTVNVDTGRAIIEGHWYKNTAVVNLAIASNTTGSTRADRIVLRLDKVAKTMALIVVTGVDGTAPLVTWSAGRVEITIGILDVPNGAASILAGYIRDLRNSVEYGGNEFGGLVSPQSYARVALDATLASNLSGSCTIDTWTDFWNPPTFDLKWNNSLVMFNWIGNILQVGSTTYGATRMLIDGVEAALLGAATHPSNANLLNGGGGFQFLRGYLKGTHTPKLQIRTAATVTGTIICLPTTYPLLYGLRVQVLEFPDMKVN